MPFNVTKTVAGAASFTLATPFDVRVDLANSASATLFYRYCSPPTSLITNSITFTGRRQLSVLFTHRWRKAHGAPERRENNSLKLFLNWPIRDL